MMTNRVTDIRKQLMKKRVRDEYVIDKTGVKMIELNGATFIADEDWIIRRANEDYVRREIDWYCNQSLNVNDIPGDTPQIWLDVSDNNGFINSNYGYLVFSEENHKQYRHALNELKTNPESRRATMIYQRPSMHKDYNKDNMSDFICTYANQMFIRDGKLVSHYIMRSNDAVFGYCNDVRWAKFIQEMMSYDLDIPCGDLIWTASSFHIYERHFKFLDKLIQQNG
jgi:thymidylate synthase